MLIVNYHSVSQGGAINGDGKANKMQFLKTAVAARRNTGGPRHCPERVPVPQRVLGRSALVGPWRRLRSRESCVSVQLPNALFPSCCRYAGGAWHDLLEDRPPSRPPRSPLPRGRALRDLPSQRRPLAPPRAWASVSTA